MIHVGSTEWYRQKTRELQRERYLMRECTEYGRIINRVATLFEQMIWSGLAPTILPEGVREISYAGFPYDKKIAATVLMESMPRYIEIMVNLPEGDI